MSQTTQSKRITPRAEDYSRWYNDVVLEGRLADYSPVKGCMVIMPHGYALWENMQRGLDAMFKATGHRNAYFPLFIPKSFLAREAQHVEGFAKECAIVTHSRLRAVEQGGRTTLVPDPESRLEEELVIRPTSETIIYSMFAKWVQSYRDLPLLINQWANVVRWEMRTRLFLRTTEFLWQEGHTAHATAEEAEAEARQMLEVYATFAEQHMAMPVIRGLKTDSERFAGAVRTYCIEALMQDGKALQAGTTHNLGQNFARAFEVKYQTEDGREEHAWNTSWGVSTRLVGALVMTHGDDNGLVLPPRLAPLATVVVPIWRTEDMREKVLRAAREVSRRLLAAGVSCHVDDRDTLTPGFKYHEWELAGVPLRIELGPKDLDRGEVLCVRRPDRAKESVPLGALETRVPALLEEIQQQLYRTALARCSAATHEVDDYETFARMLDEPGGFLLAHWCGSAECEARVKAETRATIRCLALDQAEEPGRCLVCGGSSPKRAHFARAY
jgi:prolyl-tRNA synthetase